jgi:protein involved in polysaccharide export with SLBB domain
MKHCLYSVLFFGVLCFLSACGIYNQNIMFKTDQSILPKGVALEARRLEMSYIISPNDYLVVRVFTNKGEKIIDPNDNFPAVPNTNNQTIGSQQTYTFGQTNNSSIAGPSSQQPVIGQQPSAGGSQQQQSLQQQTLKNQSFLVKEDGNINLPLIGLVKLSGYSLSQADSLLAKAYNQYYEECFVITRTLNRRIFLLGAMGGYVIPMENEHVSLIEVLARHGGPNNYAKVNNIRLIRGNLQNPQVFLIDLSTIEGMRKYDLTLQPNDIIYLQPVRKTFFESIGDLTPILSLVTSLATIIILARTLK